MIHLNLLTNQDDRQFLKPYLKCYGVDWMLEQGIRRSLMITKFIMYSAAKVHNDVQQQPRNRPAAENKKKILMLRCC